MSPGNKRSVYRESSTIKGAHFFSHEAMATVFELHLVEEDQQYAQQVAQAAFAEADRLEAELSRFVPNSDISRLNSAKQGEPIELGPDTFGCLKLAKRMYDRTGGAFDITIGALYACWFSEDKKVRRPTEEALDRAKHLTGMNLLKLDSEGYAAEVTRQGVQFDLGGIGKGYAADRLAELVRDWKVTQALIVAGASTVLALDAPKGRLGWPLTLSHPLRLEEKLARLELTDRAVSGSGQRQGSHIIDPRPGQARPVRSHLASWSLAPTAVEADALSTSFMVMNPDEIRLHCRSHPESAAMVVAQPSPEDPGMDMVISCGIWPQRGAEKKSQ